MRLFFTDKLIHFSYSNSVPSRANSGRSQRRSLEVLVFTPPLDRSGGIGALFSYARPFFPQDINVKFIDTRGYAENPLWSIFPLTKAIFLLFKLRFQNRVDVIHLNLGAHGSAFRKIIIGTFTTKLLRIPTIFQIHASAFEVFFNTLPPFLKKYFLSILNGAYKILVLGSISKAMMENIGCKSHLLEIFQMGVPELSVQIKSSSREKPSNKATRKNPIILFAGELGQRKGLPQTLESIASYKDDFPYLIVAGSGNVEIWQNFAESLNIGKRVSFVGLISYSAIHSYLNDIDALILPSQAEGLPVSVLECFSAGKIPIVTISGNLGDFLNSENSIIISKPTCEGISEAIQVFCNLYNLDQCFNMQYNAKRLWVEYFDASKTTIKLVKIWQSASIEESSRSA